MKFRSHLVAIIAFLLIGASGINAQPVLQQDRVRSMMGIEMHFRFDRSDIDPEYMDNGRTLERFSQIVDSIGLSRIDSIAIVSHSSPEGQYEYNLLLSQRRADTMRKTIEKSHPELSGLLHISSNGEAWEQLREYVAGDKKMKQSTIDTIISIIDSDTDIRTKKTSLQQQPIYRYLIQTYFPHLRNSVFCIIYHEPASPLPAIAQAAVSPKLSYIHEPLRFQREQAAIHKPASKESNFLIKTNLLYDALLSPSIELEYRIAPHWSILADYSVAWWQLKNHHQYYQLMQFGAEGRYWFDSSKPWHGHYLGLFAGTGYYDLENRERGYQGEYLMSGLSYGYMFPIGKNLSLDAGIGVGALTTKYEEYLPLDGHYVYQQTGKTNYFGPLKLRIALTWHLDSDSFSKIFKRLKGGKK